METITAVSEQEIQEQPKCNSNVTNEQVKLLTMGREWTKEERLKYLEFRKQEENRNKKATKKINKKSYNRVPRLEMVKSPEVRDLISTVKTNVHHLVPRALKWSEHEENKYRMKISAHEWLNALIWNKLLQDIIIQMLEMHKSTMHEKKRDEIINKIISVMREYIEKWEFYNEKCFKSKDFIPKTIKW